MKPFSYIVARWYEVRAGRALHKYHKLLRKAEKFFARAGLRKNGAAE